MSVSFRILPEHGVVFVRYQGHARIEDTMRVFGEYAAHPDFRPGQKQLVDLGGLTGVDRDFAKFMEMQAQKADVFMAAGTQTLLVYHAPTELGQSLAQMILRSWEPFPAVVPIIITDEAEALSVLGLNSRSFSELLAGTD